MTSCRPEFATARISETTRAVFEVDHVLKVFKGECPNDVNNAAKISVKYNTKDRPENAVITAAKW